MTFCKDLLFNDFPFGISSYIEDNKKYTWGHILGFYKVLRIENI